MAHEQKINKYGANSSVRIGINKIIKISLHYNMRNKVSVLMKIYIFINAVNQKEPIGTRFEVRDMLGKKSVKTLWCCNRRNKYV
jgi:hypothetical protein